MKGFAYPGSYGGGRVARLRARGWGVIVYPGAHAVPAGLAVALDCRRRRVDRLAEAIIPPAPWRPRREGAAYAAAVRKFGTGARFIVLPDAPDARETLRLADDWKLACAAGAGVLLIPVHPAHAGRAHAAAIIKRLSPGVGLFLAETGAMRPDDVIQWGRAAAAAGAYLHCARVDSPMLAHVAAIAGAASVSRSEIVRQGAGRLADLDAIGRQMDLFAVGAA